MGSLLGDLQRSFFQTERKAFPGILTSVWSRTREKMHRATGSHSHIYIVFGPSLPAVSTFVFYPFRKRNHRKRQMELSVQPESTRLPTVQVLLYSFSFWSRSCYILLYLYSSVNGEMINWRWVFYFLMEIMEIKFLCGCENLVFGGNGKFCYFLLLEGIHELKWLYLCWYS